MMKKARVEIEITEDGDPNIDILNAVGPSCAKDAKYWTDISGGGAKVTKKPEYFQKSKNDKVKNVQTNG